VDSATCLCLARRDGYSIRALTIKIHGTAHAEMKAAKLLAKRVRVIEHRFMSIPELREAGDIAGSRELSKKSVPSTFIPMKNAVYYSLAAAFAEEKGAACIIGGHNADDRQLFQDTSEEFFASLQNTFSAASPRLRRWGLKILRPLKDRTKSEVVALAAEIGVPLELTWSCHNSGTEHCWKCEGCRLRIDAFNAAGVEDPLMSIKGGT
jgi:7-cyano-7-deazaguanine synthase